MANKDVKGVDEDGDVLGPDLEELDELAEKAEKEGGSGEEDRGGGGKGRGGGRRRLYRDGEACRERAGSVTTCKKTIWRARAANASLHDKLRGA